MSNNVISLDSDDDLLIDTSQYYLGRPESVTKKTPSARPAAPTITAPKRSHEVAVAAEAAVARPKKKKKQNWHTLLWVPHNGLKQGQFIDSALSRATDNFDIESHMAPIGLTDLPFLAIAPILIYIQNPSQLFLANRALHCLGKSVSIRTFWIHRHFQSVTASLEDVLSPEASHGILSSSSSNSLTSSIDAYPLSLLNNETVCLKLMQSFLNFGRKDLWDLMAVIAARWGHFEVLSTMLLRVEPKLESDLILQKAVETSIAFAQIEFMTRLLAASNRDFKVPVYLKHAIQMDRPKSVAHLLAIHREITPYNSTHIKTFLQDAVIGAKFKSLTVLLNDVSLLDHESWLHLVTLAAAGGSHQMISTVLKTGAMLNPGVYLGTEAESFEMQGWKIAMDAAILKGKVDMVEYLMNISIELGTVNVRGLIRHHVGLAVREGQTAILWILLDSPQSITMSSTVGLAQSVLEYYAACYEADAGLVLDKEAVKNIRGRDTKGVLPVLRGLIAHRKATLSKSVGRSLLLMAATWNLPASFAFLEDHGACLGDAVEPILECLLRIVRAPNQFEAPAAGLVMRLLNHEATKERLFQYKDGLLLRTIALKHPCCRTAKQLWDVGIQKTPFRLCSDILERFPR
ncbi:hypothetical protein HDU98_006339 [Podochytrium sp. JEL0797]|nr:hypothetical protein HDU98_006339 [Podochytrium sp. JEL0797]